MFVYPLGARVLVERSSTCWVLVYLSGACLPVGRKYDVRASMTCALYYQTEEPYEPGPEANIYIMRTQSVRTAAPCELALGRCPLRFWRSCGSCGSCTLRAHNFSVGRATRDGHPNGPRGKRKARLFDCLNVFCAPPFGKVCCFLIVFLLYCLSILNVF